MAGGESQEQHSSKAKIKLFYHHLRWGKRARIEVSKRKNKHIVCFFPQAGSSLSFEPLSEGRRIPSGTLAASGGTSGRPSLAAREMLSFLSSGLPSFGTSPSTDSVAATRGDPSLPPPLPQEDYPDPPLAR
ncbi:UNVERIFIED_CONTAM: hypothetical protein Slati_2162800 [Sesamum latifolium]|uniref:Uncharacterized protein n=1 Tax=Sesamum latifolium TaxID=2727402 RepID=A0AAW2WWS2_9LAMI